MRRMLVAGNWKMNMDVEGAERLIDGILKGLGDISLTDVLICPPFLYLESAVKRTATTPVRIGAQNVSFMEGGALTGEISAPMLRSLGCSYVIVGHSERRNLFHETDLEINRKVKICLKYGLIPILCIGETLEQRKCGNTYDVLNRQLVYGLMGIDDEQIRRMVIAYEPVWAIGTGVSASGEQAGETHRVIRSILGDFAGVDSSEELRIIYGGSVTPENAGELLTRDDVDGALVGGASLKAETFCQIVRTAESVCRSKIDKEKVKDDGDH
jgi:triosephosphate isomerase